MADGNDQVVFENIGEDQGQIRMIEEAAESRVDIVAVLKDVFLGVGQVGMPEASEVTSKGVLIKDRGVFIGVRCIWFRNGQVGRTSQIGAIGAIHADTAFPFPHCPLKWSKHQARKKREKESRKMDVK